MEQWWKERVIYQIYPRSFQDSNGDGIGDIPGITRRLDELADLGVGAIWLSPVYPSPNADNGYDSEPFRRFQDYLGIMQQRVEARYAGARYPEATGMSGTFDPATAAANVTRWKCEVKEALGPESYAEVDVSGAPTVSVTVFWSEPDTDNLADGGKIELETTL